MWVFRQAAPEDWRGVLDDTGGALTGLIHAVKIEADRGYPQAAGALDALTLKIREIIGTTSRVGAGDHEGATNNVQP